MRTDSLPSPGRLSNGFALRSKSAKAISVAQIAAYTVPGGKTRHAAVLQAFFTACAAALAGIADNVAPTVTTRVRTSATQIVITFSDVLEPSVLPLLSSFSVTAGTLTGAAIVGSTVVLTGTGLTVGSTVAYVVPATNALRDRPGNLLAAFSGVTA